MKAEAKTRTYSEPEQLAFQQAGSVLPSPAHAHDRKLLRPVRGDGLVPPLGRRELGVDLALRQAGEPCGRCSDGSRAPSRSFVDAARVAAVDRPRPPTARALSRAALQAGSHERLGRAARGELAATGAVESVDLKGAYKGTLVDQPPDPRLYKLVAEGFPDAWIEDPALTPETDPLLAPYRERITWDAPIHSVADIESLPFPPRTINIKPSRFGSIEALCDTYDYLEEQGIGAYGGGQFELASDAPRTSTWPRSSIPARPTTSRRRRTTRTS